MKTFNSTPATQNLTEASAEQEFETWWKAEGLRGAFVRLKNTPAEGNQSVMREVHDIARSSWVAGQLKQLKG